MITVYGLKNCDTCRNARKWLKAEGLDFTFHDVRADGLTEETLSGWIRALGWETLLNRRGTTWRKLPDDEKEGVDEARAKALMLSQPALIKRPVFEKAGQVIVGFKDAEKVALKG